MSGPDKYDEEAAELLPCFCDLTVNNCHYRRDCAFEFRVEVADRLRAYGERIAKLEAELNDTIKTDNESSPQLFTQLATLRSVLSGILDNPYESCPMCDFGQVRRAGKTHWPDCQYAIARAALEEKP